MVSCLPPSPTRRWSHSMGVVVVVSCHGNILAGLLGVDRDGSVPFGSSVLHHFLWP